MDVDIVTEMPEEVKNVSLIVEISNKQPIELIDLTKSFIALANQFNDYASQSVENLENRQGKLFVREIKTGSVIVELIEIATIGVLPFMENVNTIVGFGEYVKRAYDFILGKTKDKPKELNTSGFKDLSQIVNPVAKDSASQLNISTKVDGNVYLEFNIGNIEANAVQNIVHGILKEAKGLEDDKDIQRKVLLTFYQIRTDVTAKTGNKGVIESISTNPVNLLFQDELLNDKMIHGDVNPSETIYVVDVLPQKADGKIAAYKILALHETFPKPE